MLPGDALLFFAIGWSLGSLCQFVLHHLFQQS